jgi:putative hemolysin
MISGVMRLADRSVKTVMTPRMDIDWIEVSASREEIRARVRATSHARLPVCDGSPDRFLGIVRSKDLLDALLDKREFDVRAMLQQPLVIPDTLDTLGTLERLRTSPLGIAAVHDEYGHFEGVVTAMDVLSAIAGEFATPGERIEPAGGGATRRDDGSWLLDGAMDVGEVAETLMLPLPDERLYHTLAGLVLHHLKRLPKTGDWVDVDGWRLEVVDMDGRRIDKILAQRAPLRHRGG